MVSRLMMHIFQPLFFHSYPCMDSTETIGIADDIQGIYQTGHGLPKGWTMSTTGSCYAG